MNRILGLLMVLTGPVLGLAQNTAPRMPSQVQQPAASSPGQSAALQSGSLIYAELSKSLDSKKAKVGDPVLAKISEAVLSHGKIAIPKNAKVIGHITAAKARTKDQPQAELGIALDRAELKDGTKVPLTSVTIQAMGGSPSLEQPPSNVENSAGTAAPTGMSSSRSGANMGGTSSPMGGSRYPSNQGTAGPDMSTGSTSGGTPGSGRLNAGSRGVVGISGLRLESQPQGGTLLSGGKNIKLDSGTQLVLRSQ
ncbi:MAG: TrbI/VirB10 family protein [Acidobacteria bacterium]|nr:TrbI/VirB10 family protein [Acidobacteriota bacterium]